MAKRTGYNTSIVSTRQDDKDKAEYWFNKLSNRTQSVPVPTTGNKPTPTPTPASGAQAGATAGGAFSRVFAHKGGIGQPTDRPQNEMDRLKYEANQRRIARNKKNRAAREAKKK